MTHLLRAAVSLAGLFQATAVLGRTTTLECDYPRYSDGETIQQPKQRFALTFLIDKAKGTAYILGNQGSAEVNLVPSPNGFTFIEITPTGSVMIPSLIFTAIPLIRGEHGLTESCSRRSTTAHVSRSEAT